MSNEQAKKNPTFSEADTVVPGNSEKAKVPPPKIDLSDLFGGPSPSEELQGQPPIVLESDSSTRSEISLGEDSHSPLVINNGLRPDTKTLTEEDFDKTPSPIGISLEEKLKGPKIEPVKLPTYEELMGKSAPNENTPSPAAPVVSPQASVPHITTPQVHVPQITTPQVTTPQVSTAHPPISLPQVSNSHTEVSAPSFAKGGAAAVVSTTPAPVELSSLPDPNAPKPEEPVSEQEAQTQIVGKGPDPSIFESATVIRPAEVSMSEVTQYLKDMKGKSQLHEDRPGITPFGDAPQFERRANNRRSDPKRKGGRRGTDPQTTELFSLKRTNEVQPIWFIGIAASAAFVLFFAFSSWRGTEKKVEVPSVTKEVPEDGVENIMPAGVTAQLKVEFLSDLHKNIETTKAHAPLY